VDVSVTNRYNHGVTPTRPQGAAVKNTPAEPQPAVAYSYVRFSTPEQAKGDSLRRQTEAAADWCARNGARLDTGTTFRDLGKSAYSGSHRQNPDRNALAAFLKLVEDGKILQGSYLVIENLDRLSREHIQPALLLVLNLLQAGIRIVQLKPSELVFTEKSDTLPVRMMMVELSRGHSESAMKSKRVGQAWVRKRLRAQDGKHILTKRLPGWIEEHDGELRPFPEKAAAVRAAYEEIHGYLCYYDTKRRHSSLNYLTPSEFELSQE